MLQYIDSLHRKLSKKIRKIELEGHEIVQKGHKGPSIILFLTLPNVEHIRNCNIGLSVK